MNIKNLISNAFRTELKSGPETGAKKNEGIKNFFKAIFNRPSSSGKSTDGVQDSLKNKISAFNNAGNLAKQTVSKNSGTATVHITQDNTSPKNWHGVPPPNDAPPQPPGNFSPPQSGSQRMSKPAMHASANLTSEQANQQVKSDVISRLTSAVHLDKLEMTWCTSAADKKRNAPMLAQLAEWKSDIPRLINMIASRAILDKSERPAQGPHSLSGHKQELLEKFRSSAEYAMSDSYTQRDIDNDVEKLRDILTSIDPDQGAQKKIKNENRKAPDYVPLPPASNS